MNDSEATEKTYRESIRRNRQERWAEFKRNFGSSGSMSGKEALFAIAFTLIAFVAVPVTVIYFHNRNLPKELAEKNKPAETRPSIPMAYIYKPSGQTNNSVLKKTAFPDSGKKKDPEMSRKYKDIVKKKQQLSKEMDSLLRQYTRHCLKEPMGRARQKMCDRIDRKNQECARKIKRLRAG
jgi:uncharacterized protein with von Willebrand factor type A (vWA) domain